MSRLSVGILAALLGSISEFFRDPLTHLIGVFEASHYWGPFGMLMLCGLGAPMPEELTLIGCGYLMNLGLVEFVPITIVCTLAILLGDSIPYWLGRLYGLSALRSRWVAKVLHPERFARLERKFEKNGNWAAFSFRFMPGLRIPGYFFCGTLRMSYARFLLIDFLGVLVSVPTSIAAAYFVIKKIGFENEADRQRVRKIISEYNHWLLLGIVVLIVGIIVWRKLRKKSPPTVVAPRVEGHAPPPGP